MKIDIRQLTEWTRAESWMLNILHCPLHSYRDSKRKKEQMRDMYNKIIEIIRICLSSGIAEWNGDGGSRRSNAYFAII